jgi:hypothetical protein
MVRSICTLALAAPLIQATGDPAQHKSGIPLFGLRVMALWAEDYIVDMTLPHSIHQSMNLLQLVTGHPAMPLLSTLDAYPGEAFLASGFLAPLR